MPLNPDPLPPWVPRGYACSYTWPFPPLLFANHRALRGHFISDELMRFVACLLYVYPLWSIVVVPTSTAMPLLISDPLQTAFLVGGRLGLRLPAPLLALSVVGLDSFQQVR